MIKRAVTSSSVNISDEKLTITSSNICLTVEDHTDNLTSSFSNLNVSTSTLNEFSNLKDKKGNKVGDSNMLQVGTNMMKSKSMSELNEKEEGFKLASPYGDCGGAGSGGCIFTGPYEPMIITKEEWSDESFESTEESDAAIDYNDINAVTHANFENAEVVWAKRPALPWFPGILIDPFLITKEIKELMKNIGAKSPHKDQLTDYSTAIVNSKKTDRLYFVLLFNRKRTWLWLPESKLRPFGKENDKIFLENSALLTTRYKRELDKAYGKAKKFSKVYQEAHEAKTHHSFFHLHHHKHHKL